MLLFFSACRAVRRCKERLGVRVSTEKVLIFPNRVYVSERVKLAVSGSTFRPVGE